MWKKNLARAFAARISKNASHIEELKSPVSKSLVIEYLTDRALVKVEGIEAVNFLQGLITNDMKHLARPQQAKSCGAPAMYAMFLNKSGRMLYDTIIYRQEQDSYLIECDKNVAIELQNHLCMHRVRRPIDIKIVNDKYKPWVIFDPQSKCVANIAKRVRNDIICTLDPRVRGFGWRCITAANNSYKDLSRMISIPGEIVTTEPTNEQNYRYRRYCYGIGEGVDELPPGQCIPLEMNVDYLHGISFQKGCYIGQELTARAHHTGVVRKRLMPILFSGPVPKNVNTIQTESSTAAGTLRGVCKDRGLALLRIERVEKSEKLLIDGEPCYVSKPDWWPKELLNKGARIEKAVSNL